MQCFKQKVTIFSDMIWFEELQKHQIYIVFINKRATVQNYLKELFEKLLLK